MNMEINRLIRSLCFRLWWWAVMLNTLFFGVFVLYAAGSFFLPAIFLVSIVSLLFSIPALGTLHLLLPALVYHNLPYRSLLYIMLVCCALLGAAVFLVFTAMVGGVWGMEYAWLMALPAAAGAGAMGLLHKRLQIICREQEFLNQEIHYLGQNKNV